MPHGPKQLCISYNAVGLPCKNPDGIPRREKILLPVKPL
jgi:hypothetical protein